MLRILIFLIFNFIYATIDIPEEQWKFLANKLSPEECRKLVASLRSPDFEVPKHLDYAESALPADARCFDLLLGWNSKEGLGRTHSEVVRRLNQIHRPDLAQGLSISVFKGLTNNVRRQRRDSKKYMSEDFPFTTEEIVKPEVHIIEDDDTETNVEAVITIGFFAVLGVLCFRFFANLKYALKKLCKKKGVDEEVPLNSTK